MSGLDREMGELSTEIRLLRVEVTEMKSVIELMRKTGCHIGENHEKRLAQAEASVRKIIITLIIVLVGGQAGIETIRQLFLK